MIVTKQEILESFNNVTNLDLTVSSKILDSCDYILSITTMKKKTTLRSILKFLGLYKKPLYTRSDVYLKINKNRRR